MAKALEQKRIDSDGEISAGIEATSLFVKLKNGGRKALEVLLVHANSAMPIQPPQMQTDGMLFTSPIPELDMPIPQEVRMKIAVLAPMCNELGATEWWTKFAGKKFPFFKEDLAKLISSNSLKINEREMRVNFDRTLQWRGEALKDSRVTAYVKIPQSQDIPLLSRSGRRGLTIDRADRDDEEDMKMARIEMPSECTLADVLRKIDALPQDLRQQLRGVVPGRRNYIVRVTKEAQPEAMRKLAPELAEAMGQSLGMTPSSTWIIKNIHRDATKAAIIAAFAQTKSMEWGGWRIIPIRTAEPRRLDCRI